MKALILLLGLSAVGYQPTPTQAADMPTKAPLAPVSSASWSGLYFGINVAGAKADANFTSVLLPGTGNVHPSGGMAGATVGAGTWLTPGLYTGIEADGAWDFTKSNTPCVFNLTTCRVKEGMFFTERAVIGFTIPGLSGAAAARGVTAPAQWPIPLNVPSSMYSAPIMIYGTGGVAERQMRASVDMVGSNEQWIVGPVFGGGLKYVISSGTSLKAEYLHVIWNKHFNPVGPTVFPADFKTGSEDILRLGLDFHL